MNIVKELFTPGDDSTRLSGDVNLHSLFNEFYDRLVYFSMQILKDKDHAEDVVQDAFIKYWQQKETVAANKIAIKNFLYSTVRNASLNIIRHTKVVADYAQQQEATEQHEVSSVIDAIITTEVLANLHVALQSLPENYRKISMMGYFDGKKNHEIADELNMSVNTIKKQKQKALQLMRMKLTPELLLTILTLAIFTR